MKTKDFIKLLQKEDPTGEGYIRINNGPITSVVKKEGYWDGPYSYIEKQEDGKPIWVETTRGYKIDVYTINLWDFAERFQGDWEEMKKHIRIEYDYLDDGEKEQAFLKLAKQECIDYKKMSSKLYEASYKEMVENAKKGWRWFQNKKVDKEQKPNLHTYYTWKIYNEKKKNQGSNIYQTECVIKSGDWQKVDNGREIGYFEWIYKE